MNPSVARTRDLCSLSELDDPGSRGFDIDLGTEPKLRLFLVLKDGVLSAFRNSCPHTGAPLEWQADQFLDLDNGFIQCALHGALFRTDDGYCLRGPCVGASLERLESSVVDGRVRVTLPA